MLQNYFSTHHLSLFIHIEIMLTETKAKSATSQNLRVKDPYIRRIT